MEGKLEVYFEEKDGVLTIRPAGRLDTFTAPELEKQLEGRTDEADQVVMDLSQVNYISSAGLRVLLLTEMSLEKRGRRMKLTHVSEHVKDILGMTGFLDMVELEE